MARRGVMSTVPLVIRPVSLRRAAVSVESSDPGLKIRSNQAMAYGVQSPDIGP